MIRLAAYLAAVLQVTAASAQTRDTSAVIIPGERYQVGTYTNNAESSRFYVQTGFHF